MKIARGQVMTVVRQPMKSAKSHLCVLPQSAAVPFNPIRPEEEKEPVHTPSLYFV